MVEGQYAQEPAEQQFWTECPFEPEGLLAEIPALLNQGIIPVNYRPQTDEDRTAIYILRTAHEANTPEECTALTMQVALRNRLVLPRRVFWCYMAAATYPTLAAEDARYRSADPVSVKNDPVLDMARKLADAWETKLKVGRSVNNSALIDVTPSDVPREIATLAGRLESLCGSLGISDQWSLYSRLAVNQITFIHQMWWQCGTEEARHNTASIGTQNQWYFANLMLAIACVARAYLEELYKPRPNEEGISITPGLSPAALNYLFGRTANPDGYIAARTRNLSPLPEEQKEVRYFKDHWAKFSSEELNPLDQAQRQRELITNGLLDDSSRDSVETMHLKARKEKVGREQDKRNAQAKASKGFKPSGNEGRVSVLDGSARFHLALWHKKVGYGEDVRGDLRDCIREDQIVFNRGQYYGGSREKEKKRMIYLAELEDHQIANLKTYSNLPLPDYLAPMTADPIFEDEIRTAGRGAGLRESDISLIIAKGKHPKCRESQMREVYGRLIPENEMKAADERIRLALPYIGEQLHGYLRGHGSQPQPKPTAARSSRNMTGHCRICNERLINRRCPRELEFDHGHYPRRSGD